SNSDRRSSIGASVSGSAGGAIAMVGKRTARPPASAMRRTRPSAWCAGRVTRTPTPASGREGSVGGAAGIDLLENRARPLAQQVLGHALAERDRVVGGTAGLRPEHAAAVGLPDQRAQMQLPLAQLRVGGERHEAAAA